MFVGRARCVYVCWAECVTNWASHAAARHVALRCAVQVLYPRSVQPLAFWEEVLPWFTPLQQGALRKT